MAKKKKKPHSHSRFTKTSPKTLARRDKDLACLELRADGWTMEEIAQKLGLNSRQAVAISLDRALIVTYVEPAERYRKIAYGRLMKVMKGVLPGAKKGKPDAVRAFIRVEQQIAKTMGYTPPERLEVSGPGGQPIKEEVDLKILSDDELTTYRDVLRKLTGRDRAPVQEGVGGNGAPTAN